MQDYRFRDKPRRKGFGKTLLLLIVVAAIGAGAWVMLGKDGPSNSTTTATPTETKKRVVPLTLPAQSSRGQSQQIQASAAEPAKRWTHYEVAKGDTLSSIFRKLDLPYGELNDILALGKDGKQFTRLKPGQKMRIQHLDSGGFASLELEPDDLSVLRLERKNEQLVFQRIEHAIERRARFAFGEINNSLFADGTKAGLSNATVMKMADVFGWDIDFALDLRAGDRFTVLIEDIYRDGEPLREGDILAAEFVNQGKAYRAVRYTDPKGHTDFYSPEGKTMRKAFLRNPLDVVRITSQFNLRRKHPVLNRIRAHKGVDYGAPTGTPVRAVGDGVIQHRGRKGGYGRTVIVKHDNGRTTLYAHLSKYGKHKKNRKVKQGQVIGYVGKSGLATGPHLHFEFRVNGKHKNPQKVKLGNAKPLNIAYKADFKAATTDTLAQLDTVNRVLAKAEL